MCVSLCRAIRYTFLDLSTKTQRTVHFIVPNTDNFMIIVNALGSFCVRFFISIRYQNRRGFKSLSFVLRVAPFKIVYLKAIHQKRKEENNAKNCHRQ